MLLMCSLKLILVYVYSLHLFDSATERNLNLRAAMIHVIGDLVQSIGVFLASVLIKFYVSLDKTRQDKI